MQHGGRLKLHFNSQHTTMILELADIRIQPNQQAAFDEAIQRGVDTVISKAKGFEGYKINRGIESPERYVLQIVWATREDHTVGVREVRHRVLLHAVQPRCALKK